ncbi:MAG: helix-turn-helix transcriptional regulator [Oscillospiraceae bacterium]|nr:helix-turn-helix transcriptional regulator [Oscillospiraceae bacterium]
MLDLNVFGARLHALRKEKGLVLADIAKLLGTSTTQVGDMEKGKTGTTLVRLVMLAEYYHVSADYLLGITDDPTWRGKEPEE